jgi:protein TonB
MTSQEMLQSDVLDILFYSRNKAYGAYALRRGYGRRLWLAVSIALLSFSAIMFLIDRTNKSSDHLIAKINSGPVIVSEVELTPPPTPPAQPAAPKQNAPQPQAAQEKLTSVIDIVPDRMAAAKDLVPPVTDLISAAIGTEKTTGTATETGASTEPQGAVAPPLPPEPRPEVYRSDEVDEAALFPGGPDAFGRYLSRQLGTPEGLAPGETKTAKVQFVITKDGTVLVKAVLQSATAGLDALILKALKRSPKWKPARMRGEAVAVLFTLPVTFVGSEE